jgi:hypothetical protein
MPPPEERDEFVTQFYRDLVLRVAQIVPALPGQDIGYVDLYSHETGQHWSDTLLRNLGTAKVFVALISDTYLHHREWCAMEWDYFSRRRVTPAEQSAIIPVRWAPTLRGTPPPVSRIQRFTPPTASIRRQHFQKYEREGIMGLLDLDEDAYRAIVWGIARQIHIFSTTVRVAPSSGQPTPPLRRTFTEGDAS